jgi:hypothetical protein
MNLPNILPDWDPENFVKFKIWETLPEGLN